MYDFCEKSNVAIIPYGAGSSVVGGVTSDVGSKYNGTISVNLSKFNKVLEVDDVSLSAKIQGGIRGPDLERSLKNYGLTLRHFPQSFEHSTLGGWIATRSGGHFYKSFSPSPYHSVLIRKGVVSPVYIFYSTMI